MVVLNRVIRRRANPIVASRFQEPAWTPREIKVALSMATRDPASTRLALKREGFKRTTTAIVVKLKRLGVCTVDENDD